MLVLALCLSHSSNSTEDLPIEHYHADKYSGKVCSDHNGITAYEVVQVV